MRVSVGDETFIASVIGTLFYLPAVVGFSTEITMSLRVSKLLSEAVPRQHSSGNIVYLVLSGGSNEVKILLYKGHSIDSIDSTKNATHFDIVPAILKPLSNEDYSESKILSTTEWS
jgi:hypothetical protein